MEAANKKEKWPKEGNEDQKTREKKEDHPRWVPVVVVMGLLLLPVM